MNSVALYLVRHGAIVSATGKSFIGQTDRPLSEEGIAQACALREWLEPVVFSRVISSDLSRTRHTATILAADFSGRRVETFPALREIDLGAWEGLSFDDVRNRFPEEYAARGRDLENWRPPRGESFADCRVRVNAALAGILANAQGKVLLVGHAGVNRIILCSALGIPLQNLNRLGQDYGCVNILEFGPDGARVHLMNYKPATSGDRCLRTRTAQVEVVAEAAARR